LPQEGISLFSVLKKLFFWNYPRNTWQWDALCVLILAFIFLTPKSWFLNGERHSFTQHQTPTLSRLYVSAEVVENAEDNASWEQRARAITGRSDVRVLEVRKRLGQDGRLVGYEVDIR
jgi:hypothetical protein